MNISLSLRAVRRSVLVLATALGAAGSALAVSPSLVATVERIPETVTHWTERYPTFAAYQVTVTSFKPNPIVGVRFVGTATVAGGTGPDFTATLTESIGEVTCGPGATRTFDCQIGPLLSGAAAAKTFTVILKAPRNGTAINVTWDVFFDESGAGGADAGMGTTSTTLTEPNTKLITSFIPPAGSLFGTGIGIGYATELNPTTTTVRVPASTVATTIAKTASIEETDKRLDFCAANLVTKCYKSTITLPDGSYAAGSVNEFTGIVITLWRDASTLKPGAKAEDYPVYYDGSQVGLKLCSDPTFSALGLPYADNPCIKRRDIITKKLAQELNLPDPGDAIGDLRVEIWAIDNGFVNF